MTILGQVENPYTPFVGLTGSGLNEGYLYIGLDGQDPETHPQDCFWDSAGTIPALQPVDILGGYPMRLGTPTQLFTAITYSMRVRDRLGQQVFYVPHCVPGPTTSDGVFADLADAEAASIPTAVRATGLELLGYYAAGDGGGAQYRYATVQASGPGKFQSVDGAWWELVPTTFIAAEMFGAVGDGSTDNRTAIQNAIDYFSNVGGGAVWFRQAVYYCSGGLTLKRYVNLRGQGRCHNGGGDKKGTLLLIVGAIGGYCVDFQNGFGGDGAFGMSDLSVYHSGSNALRAVVRVAGVLYPRHDNVEICCETTVPTASGDQQVAVGLLLESSGGNTLYGHFDVSITNVRTGLWMVDNANANAFWGSIQGTYKALIMSTLSTYATGNTFNCAFEGVYTSEMDNADMREFVADRVGVSGYTYGDGIYVLKFVDLQQGQENEFAGYIELSGVPTPFDDGVNGSHPQIAVAAATNSADVAAISMPGMRWSGTYLYDPGQKVYAGTLPSGVVHDPRGQVTRVLRKSVDQTIPSSALTTVAIGDQSWEGDDAFMYYDTGTNQLFCREQGSYSFVGQVTYSGFTGTSDFIYARVLCVRPSVGDLAARSAPKPKTSASIEDFGVTVSGVVSLEVGDTVELQTFQNSGSDQTVEGFQEVTYLALIKV